jgi:large subunit ribosomal protein L13
MEELLFYRLEVVFSGRMLKVKTFVPKDENIIKKWYLIDASGLVLGRLAMKVAELLRGKGKPIFSPHRDTGDYVVIINAEKVLLTGKKLEQKFHFAYSGYPGGAKFTRYDKLMAQNPRKVIRLAVKGMLPSNKLSNRLITKLKIYRGGEHPHGAQKPQIVEIERKAH